MDKFWNLNELLALWDVEWLRRFRSSNDSLKIDAWTGRRMDSTYRKRTGGQTDVSTERKLRLNLHFLQVDLVVLVVPTTEKKTLNREESKEETTCSIYCVAKKNKKLNTDNSPVFRLYPKIEKKYIHLLKKDEI